MMVINMDFIENDNKFDMEFEDTQTINGKSAYELAVENGYVGTEEEWLESLHGKDGYTPVKGKDYFDGNDGYTPIKGEDYYTDEDKTEMLASVKSAFEPDVQATKQTAEQAMSIAKGRATAYVYNTLADLEAALTDEEFVAKLIIGDNFYIKALDEPDYWWDGEQKQELETEKPDLTEFVKSDEVQTMIDNSLAAIGVAEEGAYW